jgi:lysophospholipase L1-like esterase
LSFSLEEPLPGLFAERGIDFVYIGFPGTGPLTSQGSFWRDSLAETLAGTPTDLVVIQASGNYNIGGKDPFVTDNGETLLHGSEQFFQVWDRHMFDLAHQAQAAGARVGLVTVPAVDPAVAESPPEVAEHNRSYTKLARKMDAQLVDWNELLAPEGGATEAVSFDDQSVGLRAEDGVHFSPAGIPVVAQWLFDALMPDPPEPPTLMLVGDSITHGSPGGYTWRYFLDQQLGVVYPGSDLFVGPSTAPMGGDYAVAGWDTDHAAQSGRMLDCYLDGDIAGRPCGDANTAAGDLAAHNPDVMVLLLGTNDVLLDWGPSTPEQYAADVETYVGLARANNPTVSVSVMGLLPVGPAQFPLSEGERAAANEALQRLTSRLDSPDARVVYAPTDAGFDVAQHTTDGVHPNTAGDGVIATNIATALATHLGIGQQPQTVAA